MAQQLAQAAIDPETEIDLAFLTTRVERAYGWSRPLAEQAVTEYKKFMWLCKVEPHVQHHVGGLVDKVWHEHILHTKRYASFCEEFVGHFVHHVPAEDAVARNHTAATQQRVLALFGTVASDLWVNPSGAVGATCSNENQEGGCTQAARD